MPRSYSLFRRGYRGKHHLSGGFEYLAGSPRQVIGGTQPAQVPAKNSADQQRSRVSLKQLVDKPAIYSLCGSQEASELIEPDNQRAGISLQEIFLYDAGQRPAPLAWGKECRLGIKCANCLERCARLPGLRRALDNYETPLLECPANFRINSTLNVAVSRARYHRRRAGYTERIGVSRGKCGQQTIRPQIGTQKGPENAAPLPLRFRYFQVGPHRREALSDGRGRRREERIAEGHAGLLVGEHAVAHHPHRTLTHK